MNRPIKSKPSQDLIFEDYMSAQAEYEKDIEAYCDELESYCNKLDSALDKACYVIHYKDSDTEKFDSMKQSIVWSEDKWKEFLLKDE